MTSPNTQTIRCANCGTPMPVAVRSLVDAQRDAEGKSLLISDQINKFQCPNCGALNVVDAPLLYHDATKELLIAYVPMGVAAQQGKSDERIIGDLMNMLTSNLPKDQFKAYMFNPRRALTMNGLIDQVLEADGISPEVMAQQRARVDLIQRMLQSATPDALISLIKGSDDKIDAQFMQTFSLMIQRMMAQGPDEMAEIMMGLQEALLENSSYGRDLIARQERQQALLQTVANDIQAYGDGATRANFIELALRYADDDERLQAFVGLVRQAFDYQFFQELSDRIEKASGDDAEKMSSVRDRLVELTQMIDEHARQAMQQTTNILRQIVESPDPIAVLEANPHLVDDQFMAVLSMNIQEAQHHGHQDMADKLTHLYEHAVELLRAQMSPELVMLNDWLNIEDDTELANQIQQQAPQYGSDLLRLMDAVEDMLKEQGQAEALTKMASIRQMVAQAVQ